MVTFRSRIAGCSAQRRSPAGIRPRPQHRAARRRGSALVTSVALLTVMSAMVLGYLSVAVDSSKQTDRGAVELRLENAAETVTVLVLDEIWGEFEDQMGFDMPSVLDLRAYLDGRGVTNQADLANVERIEMLDQLDLPRIDDVAALAGVTVESVRIWRQDNQAQTRLFVQATVAERERVAGRANRGIQTKTIEQVWVAERPEWQGLDFALLANNINCIMCHTEIDRADRFYSTDVNDLGTFERVKLGSLESFQLRDDPHSWVAGTLYLAGAGVHEDGTHITDWDDINLKSREFDGAGKLVHDVWGDLVAADLDPADADDLQPLENLYVGYPGNPDLQVDGFLPSSFPSPFPDDGGIDPLTGLPHPADVGNRIVDRSEFEAATAYAWGSISGGTIGVAAAGTTIDSRAELDDLRGGTVAGLASVTTGNVVMIGTEANPILLNGEVAIDGDLIIQGFVKGKGALKVSGNVYMPSDVQYLDGEVSGQRTFGVSQTGEENALAISSGGNVMIGNIFHRAWGEGDAVTGDPDGGFNFILEELALFNRMEWMKTQQELPGQTVKVQIGTVTKTKKVWQKEQVFWDEETPVYQNVWTGEYKTEPIYEWQLENPNLPVEYGGKMIQVQVGTKKTKIYEKVQTGTKIVTKSKWVKIEPPDIVTYEDPVYEWQTPMHANPHYRGGNYIPRYYGLTAGSTVPVFNKEGWFDPSSAVWHAEERAAGWNTDRLTLADPTDAADPLLTFGAGSVISTLTAGDGWLSDELLHELMAESLAARDEDQPLAIDATLYSNNSIFGIIPGRNAPGLDGRLIVNGAMVAADIGLLAPKRLQLNFDSRGRGMLNIVAEDGVALRRQLWSPASAQ